VAPELAWVEELELELLSALAVEVSELLSEVSA
jgi:hypothetical protein